MIDALNLAGSENPEVIQVDEPRERAYWAHVLGIPEHELRQLVARVGPNAIDVRRHLTHARHTEWQRRAHQTQDIIGVNARASVDNTGFTLLACTAAAVVAAFGALAYGLMPPDEWTMFQREHGCEFAANGDPTIGKVRCPDGRTIVRTNVAGGAAGTTPKPMR